MTVVHGAFVTRPGHRRCHHLRSEGHEAGASRWALPWKQSYSGQGWAMPTSLGSLVV